MEHARRFAREWVAAWNAKDLPRILAHYAEGVEFRSPLVPTVAGGSAEGGSGAGVVRGKAALAAYWGRALERLGEGLRFEVLGVFLGEGSVVVRYKSVRGLIACEVFEFDGEGRVARSSAHYDHADVSSAAERETAVFASGVTPILNVSDIGSSIGWFVRLGWRECWRWPQGGGSTFAAVAAGEAQVFLCKDGQGGRGRGPNARTGGGEGEDDTMDKGVWMSVWVADVDEVHARCVAEGLDVTMPPTDEPWGVREMHVRHPDGHVLRVSRGGR